jgi:Zn finger protein HypA/HybF involved in hydrogenase expression
MSRSWTDEQLIEAVKANDNISAVIKHLGYGDAAANWKTVRKYITLLKLDTAHFLSKDQLLARARMHQKRISSFSEEFIFSVNEIARSAVKRYIIANNTLPYLCAICKIDSWNGIPLSLHLDHINGINNDNRLENLRFLCPNCHSLTDTFSGKNKASTVPIISKCIDCGESVHKDSTRCVLCEKRRRKTASKKKIQWPNPTDLIELIVSNSLVAAGKMLGVSDNAIKRHLRRHHNIDCAKLPPKQIARQYLLQEQGINTLIELLRT